MVSELYIERMHMALEGTRGTAESAPTHTFPLQGLLTPGLSYSAQMESRGEMASVYKRKISRTGSAWTVQGYLDVNYLAFFLNMGVEPNTSPSTPTNGVLTRLWPFIPTMTADDIEVATAWWDLDAQSLIADFCVLDSLTISNDANSEEGAQLQLSGAGGVPDDDSTPTPAASIGSTDRLLGQHMQYWLDTSSGIGTTAITDGRLIAAQHVLNTGATYKYGHAGPAAALDFIAIGRDKAAHNLVTTLTLEVVDMTEYDLAMAGTTVKVRVRHNGALIESVTPDYYNYVEVDTYGIMSNPRWGENVSSNRTLMVDIIGEKDATLGAPYRIAVQNARTSL
jgi:hypothetical protein